MIRNSQMVNTTITRKSSDKPIFYKGKLYSEEHKQKFKAEKAGFQVVKAPKDKSKLVFCIKGKPIGEWFNEQSNKLFSFVRRTLAPLKKG